MSWNALITWVREQGATMAFILALGLLVDWLTARLGGLVERQLAASHPEGQEPDRWGPLLGSSIRAVGHLFLLGVGAIVILDALGLRIGAVLAWLGRAGAQVALIAVLSLFAVRVVNLSAQYVERAVLRSRGEGQLPQRARTVSAVARNFGLALIVVLGALMALAALGVNTVPLLASAGVVGVAIGLGAQSLVRDVLAGFFILAEDQFAVGDTIEVQGSTGEVEHMSLRATVARDDSGTLYVIPNGEIRKVANLSRDWSRAIIDVGVRYSVPLAQALSVLREAVGEVAGDPGVAPLLQGEPQVLGVQELAAERVILRAVFLTRPGRSWPVRREANRRIKEAFERAGLGMC